MLEELSKKSVNIESVAKRALDDEKALSTLLEGLTSKNETIRENSFKTLLLISEKHPEVLYPKWDFFVEMIDSDNAYWKYIAIYIIANLTRIDIKNKFEEIFDDFYHLLNDKSMIPAAHLAGNSGKIAQAKPKLQTKITNKLLSMYKTHHVPERRDLIKGYAIESFSEYFEEAENKNKIIDFVKKQLNCKSPKTRKIAKDFLKKWD